MLWLRDTLPGAVVESLLTGRRYRISGCRDAEPFPEVLLIGIDGDHRGDGWCPLVPLQENFALTAEVEPCEL